MNDDIEPDDVGDLDGRSPFGHRLPRPQVPAHLEGRVSKSLIDAGLLDRPSERPRFFSSNAAWRIAAALVLFFAGFGSARLFDGPESRPVAASVEASRRYALLLYAGDARAPQVDDVAANSAWARDLVAEGREVSGEKLKPGGAILAHSDAPGGGGSLGSGEVQGFFIISAASDAEAVAIARSSPHFRNGGRIVVSLIEPT